MFRNISNRLVNENRAEHAIKVLAVRRPPRKELFKKWLNDKILNFCKVTSLHGYVHTVNKEYHAFERWIWIILSFFALVTAVVLLWISWNWTAETPTTTVIESTNHPTYNLPFPSVTICGMNKISNVLALETARTMKRPDNMTDQQIADKLRLLLHFRGTGVATDKEYQELHDLLELNNENVNYISERLTPKCSDILERCMWKGSLQRCDSLFQSINSSDGYCCSFNNYAFPHSNYDPKMMSSIPKQARRVTACGYQTGLSLLLKPANSEYFATEIASTGFRIMIHNSYDYADANSVVKLVPSRTEAYLSIAPESTYSTNDVFGLPPEVRNCLQSNERRMDAFQRYSYVNCMAECRSAIVHDACNCVPYTLPNNGSYTKCSMLQLKCVRTNSIRFIGSTFQLNNDSSEASRNLRSKCQCLPDCTFFTYPSEVSTGDLERKFSFNSLSFFKDVILDDQTLVHVFFNDLIATHYRKDMYQNWLGVLAAFGGLLGLFLGFSLVTGFELIYFFTIRAIFDKIAEKASTRENVFTPPAKK